MKAQLINFFILIRVNQWVKNGFVFLPLFFDKQFTSLSVLLNGFVAFLGFSLVASSIYCFNDYNDISFDKNHPQKKHRPLAKGVISKKQGLFFMLLLLVLSLLVGSLINSLELVFVLLTYFIVNVAYTLFLKKIIILDVVIIAFSFVLRIIAGGVSNNIELSYWIVLMVFLLALFLAIAKRRDEVLIFKETQVKVRDNISRYSLKLINTALVVIVTVITIAYIMYTLSPKVMAHFESNYIFSTSIFVFLGFYRYYLLLKKRVSYANPTKILLSDFPMQVIVVGWLLSFYFLIY